MSTNITPLHRPDMSPHTREYNGHVITLADDWRSFSVTGPEFPTARGFDSMHAAIEVIDRKVKLSNRASAVKISIPALSTKGEPITIHGVHRSHGLALGLPQDEYEFYPRVAWIATALRLAQDLDRQSRTLRHLCRATAIPARCATLEDAASYDTAVSRLQAAVERNTLEAGIVSGERNASLAVIKGDIAAALERALTR
jgi:hypothetical protein